LAKRLQNAINYRVTLIKNTVNFEQIARILFLIVYQLLTNNLYL